MATKEHKEGKSSVLNRLRAYRRNEAFAGIKGSFVLFCG
jgi:hypothetical protein